MQLKVHAIHKRWDADTQAPAYEVELVKALPSGPGPLGNPITMSGLTLAQVNALAPGDTLDLTFVKL